jgi:hypothetical protein
MNYIPLAPFKGGINIGFDIDIDAGCLVLGAGCWVLGVNLSQ